MTLEFASLTRFTKIFIETRKKYVCTDKEKYISANHANFVTKRLTEQ